MISRSWFIDLEWKIYNVKGWIWHISYICIGKCALLGKQVKNHVFVKFAQVEWFCVDLKTFDVYPQIWWVVFAGRKNCWTKVATVLWKLPKGNLWKCFTCFRMEMNLLLLPKKRRKIVVSGGSGQISYLTITWILLKTHLKKSTENPSKNISPSTCGL